MKTKTEEFIDKIRLKNNPNHFNKDGSLRYGYSKAIYKRSDAKVIIICSEHGDFEQIPSSHLRGVGCRFCATKERVSATKRTTKDFVDLASKKHNGKYEYSKVLYKSSTDKVIITCKLHGDFEQTPNSHLRGTGCLACKWLDSRKDLITFITEANLIHNNKYDYSSTEYIKSDLKIEIICKEHGKFKQKANSHLQGAGCPSCSDNLKGWYKSNFKNYCIKNNNGLGILYVIRCFNESESFYKVGITSNSVKTRYRTNPIPYEYEIIHEVHREPNKVYDMENYLLRALAKNSYKPLIPFTGQTECFTDIEALYKIFKDKLAA